MISSCPPDFFSNWILHHEQTKAKPKLLPFDAARYPRPKVAASFCAIKIARHRAQTFAQ